MALSLQLNVYVNPLKLCDMLYIRKAIFIRKFENNVILIKQKQLHDIKSKIFPTAKRKINRGHLLVMTNPHTRFEVPRHTRSLVIDRKPFSPTRSMWP
jgi:hypothetical protein